MKTILLGLGSNMGDARGNIARALQLLADDDMKLVKRASDYRTPAWGFSAQNDFCNSAAIFQTERDPQSLLVHCKHVEQQLGRSKTKRFGPRVIDIDILDYDGAILNSENLQLPHPRMAERAFVLVPLQEIMPAMSLADGQSITEALESLPERDQIQRL